MEKNDIEEIERALKYLIENHKDDICFRDGRVQMFDCCDIAGDSKVALYASDKVVCQYAPFYGYVEVIGLPDKDYRKIFGKYGF